MKGSLIVCGILSLLVLSVAPSFAGGMYDFPLENGPLVAVSPTTSQASLLVVTRQAGTMTLQDFLASPNLTDAQWLADNATDLARMLDGSVPTIRAAVSNLIDPDKRMYIYGDTHPIWLRVSLGDVRSASSSSDSMKWTKRTDRICAASYFVTHFCADVAVKHDWWTERIKHFTWSDPPMPSNLGE